MSTHGKNTHAIAKASGPIDVYVPQDGDDLGAISSIGAEDTATPFLSIVQEGEGEGQILNTVTGEMRDNWDVIPVYYTRQFIQWGPRSMSGGIERIYTVEEIQGNKINGITYDGFRAWVGDPLPPGAKPSNDTPTIVDTRTFLVLVVGGDGDGSSDPAIISLYSTAIAPARAWLSLMRLRRVPSYATVYQMGTSPKSRGSQRWFVPSFSVKGPAFVEHVEKAKQILKMSHEYIRA